MQWDINKLKWTRAPLDFTITPEKIEIITAPHTDLWQRHIIISETIMRLCCKWKRMKRFFRLWLKLIFQAVIIVLTNAVWFCT